MPDVPVPPQPKVVVPAAVAQLGYQQLEMRKRIAMQMMMQRRARAYPQNLGQGLTAVGDSLGDMGMMRQLQQAQAEIDARRQQAVEEAERQAQQVEAAKAAGV